MLQRLEKGIFFVVFLLGQLSFDYALNPKKAVTQYVRDCWQAEQGLPQASGMAIIQTRDGYIWIGTQEGLVRFDGVQFTIFNKQNTPALKNNFIQTLLESRDGSIWIGTGGGGLTRFHQGEFKTYLQEDGLRSNVVWDLCEDREGNLWIGTAGGGLIRFRDGVFTAYGVNEGVRGTRVLAVTQDSKGALWIGTDGGGMARFIDGKFSPLQATAELNAETVNTILEDRQGTLWIGTERGLKRLRDGMIRSYTVQDGLSSSQISILLEDRDGSLWIGMRGGGLSRFRDGAFARFTTAEGLSDDLVLSLCEDREGSLWIGTFGGGVNRLKDGALTTYSSQEGLPVDLLWSVYQDRQGAMWLGTNGGGLCRVKDGRFTTYTTKDGLSNNNIRALVQDREGNLWVGTFGGGLNRFRDGKFKVYSTSDGLSHNLIRALFEDHLGNLWIGTYGGGLNLYRDGKFTVYTMKDGLGNDTVYCIHEDRRGDLWVGTRGGGVNRIRQGIFTTYTVRDGLSDDVVLSIHEDEEGVLWISTTGGITRIKGDRFSKITNRDGLYDDQIFRILEDGQGNLWMSCNKGLFQVSKKDLNDFADGKRSSVSSISYGTADGMKARECSGGVQPAGWRSNDGRLWFPTIRGVVIADPTQSLTNRLLPPVYIENVLNDGKVIDSRGGVRLPPGRGEFEFHYTALSFLAPEKVLFRYMLDGLDKKWVNVGNRRVAYYTNIPAGRYRFRVVACNNDGLWNETGASFGFYLRPYFYQTVFFYILCGLCVVAMSVGGFRIRVKQLRAREKQLALLVDERTAELKNVMGQLEQANQELERLSLTDKLTEIANRRGLDAFMDREWRRCARESRPISLIMADIDFFKVYNDTYGHQAGDECLQKVAGVLKINIHRAGDIVSRYGGEEFVIVLSETGLEGAAAVAEKLRVEVALIEMTHAASKIADHVTISLGCASCVPTRDDEYTTLIKAADEALYQSKQKGRNRVTIAGL